VVEEEEVQCFLVLAAWVVVVEVATQVETDPEEGATTEL
jgi:hypothetical protein